MPSDETGPRVVIGGASGLIGRALTSAYESDGVTVVRLVRREPRFPNEVQWQDGSPLNPSVLAGAQAVICLNGSSVGSLPWTRKKRQMLVQSRTLPRHDIARALTELGTKAPHFVHASSFAFYGCGAPQVLTEADPQGAGYAAKLAAITEKATTLTPTPTAHVRLGIVLHPDGVLKPLIPLALAGLAGRLGPGTQGWPWVSLRDAIAAFRHIVDHRIVGPVNLTSPVAASANDITFAVARELGRPHWVPVPSFALRAVLGRDAADTLLLGDARVTPQVLEESGFVFTDLSVDETIKQALSTRRRKH